MTFQTNIQSVLKKGYDHNLEGKREIFIKDGLFLNT